MADYFARQGGLIETEKLKAKITVVGLGGIGSWSANALGRLGVSDLVLIDPDKVEEHNLASQCFTRDQVGEFKVRATASNIFKIREDVEIETRPHRLEECFTPSKIVVCALDSLEARRELAPLLGSTELFIDARMGGELMKITAIVGDDRKDYLESLFKDQVPSPEPCTARSIVYNTQIIGGMVCALVKKFLNGEEVPGEIVFDILGMDFMRSNL